MVRGKGKNEGITNGERKRDSRGGGRVHVFPGRGRGRCCQSQIKGTVSPYFGFHVRCIKLIQYFMYKCFWFFLIFLIYFGFAEIFKIYIETVSIKCSLIFLKAVSAIMRESPKTVNTRLNGFSIENSLRSNRKYCFDSMGPKIKFNICRNRSFDEKIPRKHPVCSHMFLITTEAAESR